MRFRSTVPHALAFDIAGQRYEVGPGPDGTVEIPDRFAYVPSARGLPIAPVGAASLPPTPPPAPAAMTGMEVYELRGGAPPLVESGVAGDEDDGADVGALDPDGEDQVTVTVEELQRAGVAVPGRARRGRR
jgi:hypothetical protein